MASPVEKAVASALADAIEANKAALEADAAPFEQAAVAYVEAQANALVAKLNPLEAAVLKSFLVPAEADAQPFVAGQVASGVDAVVAWLRSVAA